MSNCLLCLPLHSSDHDLGVANPEVTDVDRSRSTSEETGDVNLANALHLSDSEEEEELEDIIDDFADATSMETVRPVRLQSVKT